MSLFVDFGFGFFLYRLSDLRIFRWLDGNRVNHDVGRHIVGPVLRHSAPPERGRENDETAGLGMDRPDMDLWVHVLGGAGVGPGVQPVRSGRVLN